MLKVNLTVKPKRKLNLGKGVLKMILYILVTSFILFYLVLKQQVTTENVKLNLSFKKCINNIKIIIFCLCGFEINALHNAVLLYTH